MKAKKIAIEHLGPKPDEKRDADKACNDRVEEHADLKIQ